MAQSLQQQQASLAMGITSSWAPISSSSQASGSSPSSFSLPDSPLISPSVRSRQVSHPPGLSHRPPELPSTFLPSAYPDNRYSSVLPSDLGKGLIASPRSLHADLPWERQSQAEASTRSLLDGFGPSRSPPRPMRPIDTPSFRITPGPMPLSLSATHYQASARSRSPEQTISSGYPTILYADIPSGGPQYTRDTYRSQPRDSSLARSPSNSSAQAVQPPVLEMGRDPSNTEQASIPPPPPAGPSYYESMFGAAPQRQGGQSPFEERQANITGEQFTYALDVYSHLLDAIPSVRMASEEFVPGQRYDSLLHLASDGSRILSGDTSSSILTAGPPLGAGPITQPSGSITSAHPIPERSAALRNIPEFPHPFQTSSHSPSFTSSSVLGERTFGDFADGQSNPALVPPPGKRQAASSHGEKRSTKCLGCGATETPEWRRGPMGPRTLCNACGLVHMKLQRKRKKQEEKAALAAKEKEQASA